MELKIERYTNKSGKSKISAECVYMDTKFKLSVHRASRKKVYPYVLKISVISPETNRILQVGGKRYTDYQKKIEKQLSEINELQEKAIPDSLEHKNLLKKRILLENKKQKLKEGLLLEELNANASAYLMKDDDKTIKAEGEKLVMRLYGDYQEDISKALKRATPAGDLHARTAYDMYQNDFFAAQPGTTEKVLHNKKNSLKNVCDRLNFTPIGSLTNLDIGKVAESLQGDATSKIKLAERFLDYAGENGAYSGVNPITRYLGHRSHAAGKKRSSSILYPSVSTHISPSAERELHDYLVQHIFDEDMALGILLSKGYNMTMDRILSITWKDILIEDEEVRICDYKENYTGGTHNYTRPPTREAADFIIMKYKELYSKYGKMKLSKMLLVPAPGNSAAEKKAALTQYIRTTLRLAGVSRDDFQQAVDPDKKKAAGGAGYALLCKHYEFTLQTSCGVDLDSGLGCYLRAMRIHDTTTDYYLCLSDETGNHRLQTIMNRAQCGMGVREKEQLPPISSKLLKDDSIREYSVLPGGPEEKTAVVTKKRIFIPAGSDLTLMCKNGLTGTIKFWRDPKEILECASEEIY